MRLALSLLLTTLPACERQEPPPPPAPVEPPAPVVPPYQPGPALAAAIRSVPAKERAEKNPLRSSREALEEGRTLYQSDCAPCHGVGGDGAGTAAAALPQPPTDFRDPSRWAATTDGEKAWIVRNGIADTAMSPRELDEEQTWAVLAYMEVSFQKNER